MYNLIMQGGPWEPDQDDFFRERMFEHTDKDVVEKFKPAGKFDYDALMRLPCLLMQEGVDDQIARLCRITGLQENGQTVRIQYAVEPGMPILINRDIANAMIDFGILTDWEFNRTHWAIKNVDLYRAVLKANKSVARSKPKVFAIPDREQVDPALLSVMMPFDAGRRPVYDDIKAMAATIGMRCKRGDDIWDNDAIIQDIVDLLDKSRIVICDLTGRNANVFYETGIAHTLGRDIILITESAEDVPFDLRHLRYIRYYNNGEGRTELCTKIKERIGKLVL